MKTLLLKTYCFVRQAVAAAAFVAAAISSCAAEPAAHAGHHEGTTAATATTIKSAVKAASPVSIDKAVSLTLTLSDANGKAVTLDDLREIHTKKIHMLIIDPSLSDYQHEHPDGTEKRGEYSFQFKPKYGGTYYFYADLLPVKSNVQEYSLSTLEVPGERGVLKKQENRTATSDGYRFDLAFEKPELVQGKGNPATLTVSTADGKPFNELEPVMGAFAHLVAFSEDRKHVLHVHPQGKEPTSNEERGGPILNFYVNPSSAGYQQLFAQVQINGRQVFAPFGLNVQERRIPNNVAGILTEVDENIAKLKNAIELGQLHEIHGIAFWTRDVMNGLPKAMDTSNQVKAKLSRPLENIKSLADKLDHVAHSNDGEQAKEVLTDFLAQVESVRESVGASRAPRMGSDNGEVKLVGNRNCPVSNMPVGSMEPGAAIVYKGQKIGLCCNGCKTTFDKDPETYLKKALQDAASR